MSFQFGSAATPRTTGMGFGATTATPTFGSPAQGAPNTGLTFGSGLSFGTPQPQQQTAGITFGTPANTQPTALSFGTPSAAAAATTTQQTALNFGTPTSTPQTGLTFGTPATSAPVFGSQTPSFGQAGLSFGSAATTTQPQAAGFSFGAPAAATTAFGAPATSTTFGAPATSTSFGAPATSTTFGAPATSTTFGAPATSTTFGAPATSTTFGAPVTSTAFGAPATSTTFGAPATGTTFGAPATSTSFGAPATSTTFGGPATSTAFGTQATSTVFGAPATSTAFGATATPTFSALPTATTSATTAAFNITATPQFGAATTTSAFGLPTTTTSAGLTPATTAPTLGFGTPNTTATAPLSFGLGTTATTRPTGLFSTTPATTAAAGLGFGATPATTSIFSLGTGTSFVGKSFGALGTSTVAPTTTATTTTSVGLGGLDPSQNKLGLAGSGSARTDNKAVKENQVENEIVQTVDNFKNFLKTQKNLSSDVARGSAKPLNKVQEETENLKQTLASLQNGIQRSSALVVKLKSDTAKCLQNAEMAQRTHETPPGLQYDNTAPLKYFQDLVSNFEHEMKVFKLEINNTEKHLHSLMQPMPLTSQELSLAMRRLHDSFVALAGRLQSVHNSVETEKNQYLLLRKYFLKDSSNVFEEEARKSVLASAKTKSSSKASAGPTPFSALGGQHGFGLLSSSSTLSKPSLSSGWSGGHTPQQQLQQAAAQPAPTQFQQSQFSTPTLSNTLFAGANTTSSLTSPQPVENQSFQLQKPPLGNKRGKRTNNENSYIYNEQVLNRSFYDTHIEGLVFWYIGFLEFECFVSHLRVCCSLQGQVKNSGKFSEVANSSLKINILVDSGKLKLQFISPLTFYFNLLLEVVIFVNFEQSGSF
ncbi:Nuclear pore complex protein Nup98-Nup96 [Gryllus bimaculatus]|nr:Nuclear pore complex protein Nup98-Nup96 [Gryllus bimaculatus]